ncbi:atp-binding sub-family g member 2d [Nannochloropsis gaditana]|uniref:Atp-binding sub-family g member 2d n=2 Tax=Nannochloropsis gaditana TaxID=72520 RepID=W7TJZ5_9STRA|nr:atp-binding sub-family g member 2d [Nannochloropsis gaditana]
METLSQYFFWRPVFVHELNSHTYSPLSFLLASPLTLLPWVGSAYLLFLFLSFLMADIPTPFFPSFLLPLLLIYLVLLTTYFLTLGLCARLKRPELAYVLTPITFVIMGSLTGFMVIPSQTPFLWQQIQRVLYTRWAYRGVVLLLFASRPDKAAVLDRLGFEFKFEGEREEIGTCFAVVLGWCLLLGSGEMMAVMGPSGSGKSTFLDVLAGRKTQGRVGGQVVWEAGEQAGGRCRWAYVTQEDVHLPSLTVRETLWYAALLRLEESVGPQTRLARVEALEGMLGLSEVRDTSVGGAGFKNPLSGGERRRLSVGVEIIDLPTVLLGDEVTTGLDSATALEVLGVGGM